MQLSLLIYVILCIFGGEMREEEGMCLGECGEGRERLSLKKGVGDIVIEIKTPFFQLCEVHYQVDMQSQGGD